MKRQPSQHASPSLNTPANLAHKTSSVRSFSPEEIPTAAAAPSLPPHQHRQSTSSDTPAPYSAGLFGRQRAAKGQHLPDVDMPAALRDSPKVSPLSTPAAHSRGASPLQDALDRFNARRSNCLLPATAPSKSAQQPVDALDRFNARKGFTQQTCFPHKAVAHLSGAGLNPAAQAHPNRAPTDPQHPGPQPAHQQQQTQRGMDALDHFNRRKGFKASSNSLSMQGADPAAQHRTRLHPQASQQAQQPLELASPHPRRLQSAGYQQASEELPGQDNMAEDSQQSHTTSLQLQRVSDLRGGRPSVPLVEGFTATHTPDALDRVNSILLARRKSRIGVSAAQVCHTSASPDATVSGVHAQTVGTQVTNRPVDMPFDEVEQSSCAQMQQDDAVPSGMYSSRLHPTTCSSDLMHTARVPDGASGSVKSVPLVKKRMRAVDDGDDGSAGDSVIRKKVKAVGAVPVAGMYSCHTTGKSGAQQGGVFARLAQKCL